MNERKRVSYLKHRVYTHLTILRVQRLFDVLSLFDTNARMLSRRIVYQKEPHN